MPALPAGLDAARAQVLLGGRRDRALEREPEELHFPGRRAADARGLRRAAALSPLQEFVKDIAKKPSKYFWIDISGPDRSQIRLSGSCLDQSGLPLGSSKGCRALKGNRILTETCGSMISWICQKAAVAL
ncbi:killer cell lectin-like receptor subfamily B member 1B allele C [Apteryx rowi]|uniref:killer cell lectin-like receptor subfamily B member 1B allele C n=1 Tax=Apteryx rowi TaxID=308060 RepID=UPI000E1DC275|nr:killer cell lectin-like receptor subfamily B member 1B allele C [Apteryx rowi]